MPGIRQYISLPAGLARMNLFSFCAATILSDHATLMFAAAFYLLMARGWATYGIPLLVVAALTAWGRVYSGIHFPFDMAGSIVVGLASAGLMHWLAGPLLPLNEKLLKIIDQVLGVLIKRGGQRRW